LTPTSLPFLWPGVTFGIAMARLTIAVSYKLAPRDFLCWYQRPLQIPDGLIPLSKPTAKNDCSGSSHVETPGRVIELHTCISLLQLPRQHMLEDITTKETPHILLLLFSQLNAVCLFVNVLYLC